jgi:hypothetical protein
MVVGVELDAAALQLLIELGWLRETAIDDRKAICAAVAALLKAVAAH